MIDSFASNKTTIHIKIQVKYLINKYGEEWENDLPLSIKLL